MARKPQRSGSDDDIDNDNDNDGGQRGETLAPMNTFVARAGRMQRLDSMGSEAQQVNPQTDGHSDGDSDVDGYARRVDSEGTVSATAGAQSRPATRSHLQPHGRAAAWASRTRLAMRRR